MKLEFQREFAHLRFSFSRPGFLTFKIASDSIGQDTWDPNTALEVSDEVRAKSIFARSVGVSLAKMPSESPVALIESLDSLDALKEIPSPQKMHFWLRDKFPVSEHGFEPRQTNSERIFEERIGDSLGLKSGKAVPGEIVLDCVEIDPELYWLGFHRATDLRSCYPGGLFPIPIPGDMVSRAWLKFEEAIRWSGFPIGVGTRCVDLGSSPGGASQALLTRGADVLGVDPAEMDPRILAFPNFTHFRGKIRQAKRSLFRKSQYAIADMNVAPKFTLDALEDLVTYRETNFKGLLFTLKMLQRNLAEEIPEYVRRIRSWGFKHVRVQQLQFNRQEITVAAN